MSAPLPPLSPADEAAAQIALLQRMVDVHPAPTREALQAQIAVLARIVTSMQARLAALEGAWVRWEQS